ncbi:hypothetical protein [Candidatus Bodocaedibacter vickermanii]|uniref:Phosphoenolpyruvate carboxykinase (ATP) n=1 Tax=Candidatus Bodocaedibacter vickermanii TaxID=2741701 RepID=A0A7L9RSF8_9PROT|nr:phosphoenolpyruvate carboxykinase (ATP) [Candidatus Paracaedibacteraceae bacterium 'Lake Konstanz']
MKITLFFTFLIINIANATLPTESGNAVEPQQACTYFEWNPYNLKAPRTVHPAPSLIFPPIAKVPLLDHSLSAPAPIGMRDHLTEHPPLSENRSETLLIDTQRLCDTRNLTLSHDQHSYIDQLLKNYIKFSASSPPLPPKRIAKIFQHLQDFLNSEYVRLGARSTDQQHSALMQQYQQLLRFHKTVIKLALFSPDQIKKLHCFHVSTLIGISNVCGIKKDNSAQLRYLGQALSLTKSIGTDVQTPYRTKQNFYVQKVTDFCREKLFHTQNFLLQKRPSQ